MTTGKVSDEAIQQAARAIAEADALLIGAGAGMGVDSGLPDFRGNEGFWKAYPPFRGQSFASVSNPIWFRDDPEQAWGFFGHRLNLYRDTPPHAGFQILRRWAESRPAGYFVFSSNVDGHFARSGFDESRILECHGSIHFAQCVRGCSRDSAAAWDSVPSIWPADDIRVEVDNTSIRATSPLPTCPRCGGLARPNVLMFGDSGWIPDRTAEQEERYARWLKTVAGKRIVAVEFGAGLAIPTVRHECEGRADMLIRVNPRESDVPRGGISLSCGALEAIQRIDSG
jgi:NAD-dependent SIR2 family protein deacetylase